MFETQRVSALSSWYKPALAGLSPEANNKILGILNKYSLTLKQLRQKISASVSILEAPHGKLDNKKDKAEKTLIRYKKLIHFMNHLDIYMLQIVREDAVSALVDQELKELAAKV